MSPGVCRRWHRRLWDGGKLVASQGRNNTALSTNTTTINTATATSTSVRPNTWSTAQDWFATRFRFLEAGLYHSTPSNKTSRYFKNVPMKYFANKWKKETWPKQSCICYAWRFCNQHRPPFEFFSPFLKDYIPNAFSWVMCSTMSRLELPPSLRMKWAATLIV